MILGRYELASFPGAKGVRSAPGFHCLRMRVIIAPLAWERGSSGKEWIRAIAEVTWTTLFLPLLMRPDLQSSTRTVVCVTNRLAEASW